jgi:hypothetical protein
MQNLNTNELMSYQGMKSDGFLPDDLEFNTNKFGITFVIDFNHTLPFGGYG